MSVTSDSIRRGSRRYNADLREHKFFPPAARRGAIVRHTLLERVTRLGVPHVVILQAPLGSGKSTLMQQILDVGQTKQWITGWLILDESDNDPSRFEACLIAVIMQMLAQVGAIEQEPSGAQSDNMLEWVLGQITKIPGPIALFIDDFQCIHEPAILRLFRDLLRALPGRCRVFIGSRSLPDIGISALLVSEQALVLRMEDLCFSQDESVAFLNESCNEGIDAQTATFIQARTEGWPAGLQLFKLVLARTDARKSFDALRDREPLEVVRYLSENTLALQQSEVQMFLLKTSLLRRVSAALCEEALELSDAEARLHQCEQGGLFIEALDGNPGWFKYHSLFARFLSERLAREQPDSVLDVHRRAAKWYAQHGVPEEALFHGVEAREYSLAISILDGWASRLIASAELATVAYWYDRLPPHEVIRNQSLANKVAWALIFLRRGGPRNSLLSHLDATRAHSVDSESDPCNVVLAMAKLFNNDDLRGAARLANVPALHHPARDSFEAFELGAAANLLAFSAMAEWQEEEIHRFLVLADSHNEHAQAAFSQGYTEALRCMLQIGSAQPRLAVESPRATASNRYYVNRGMAAAALAATRIWACYEADELNSAERLAEQFEQDIALAAVPEFIALSMVSIARVHLARGRIVQAQDALDRLERLSFQSQWSGIREMIVWERIYIAGRSGKSTRVEPLTQRLSSDASPPDRTWIPVTETLSGPLLGRIRLALQQDRLDRASALLNSALAIAPVRPLLAVKLHVLQALLQHKQGNTRLALRTLQQASEAARAGGCYRALLDEGAELVSMLEPTPGADSNRTARHPIPGIHKASWFDALSQREREILRLLCSGASNRAISEKLFLSENTVKFHLKNLYLKLDVKSRAQAISKVQQDIR